MYFEKLVVAHVVQKVSVFMGRERSLLFSHDTTTVTYLEKNGSILANRETKHR